MFSISVLLGLIVLITSLEAVTRIAETPGRLWCHIGGERRVYDYSPMQCEPGAEECFKFTCSGGQYDFTARGCGVSVITKATGLRNESCFQAMSVCQYLGGVSECDVCANTHMCNGGIKINRYAIIITILLFYHLCY